MFARPAMNGFTPAEAMSAPVTAMARDRGASTRTRASREIERRCNGSARVPFATSIGEGYEGELVEKFIANPGVEASMLAFWVGLPGAMKCNRTFGHNCSSTWGR